MTEEAAAFVTGGSGFIGDRLVRRLVADGRRVRALARSDDAAAKVAVAGAEPVRGDLSDPAALRAGAEGCELAFHAAAAVLEWGPREEFVRANVDGTRHVLEACREAGVRRLVHVGTEAATMAGQPLVEIDETAPLRP
ncbi:MAG TPA: NAD-dependent epimerase/dehydratase family protein, partial [Solirubrobacteraceae bacterium]|nr:NAD-dependent epimerase/dehydratase family protein [Solirubrobacteraceae bacterium]